ncbi:MAG: hypothetical protein AAF657_08320 [Acidobacteriota bacterium]
MSKKSKTTKVPGAEDFTREAIYRAVLKDTVQYPATLMPAVASALSGLYMGLFGAGPKSLAMVFGGALVAAGSWVFNYFIRGEKLAQKRVAKLRALREAHHHEQVATLESEWATAGLAEGVQQARELREAYQKLETFLRGRLEDAGRRGSEAGGFNVQRLMVLAEDTYREGVAILKTALATFQAIQQVDHEKLRRELEAWQSELEGVRQAGAEASRIESLETRIASHERRLQLFRQRVESVDRLFAESEALEAALENTYLESVDLDSAENLFARGQASSALERAVTAARRVEDRLRDMNNPGKDDDIYLTAADRRAE